MERFDAAFGDAHPCVGNDQVGIDVDDPPEPVAGLAGTDGVVEREDGRRGISVVEVAPLAVELLAEPQRFSVPFDPRLHAPFAESEGGFHASPRSCRRRPGSMRTRSRTTVTAPSLGSQLGLFHRTRPALFEHPGESRLPENFPQRGGAHSPDPTGEADKGIFPGRLRQEVIQDRWRENNGAPGARTPRSGAWRPARRGGGGNHRWRSWSRPSTGRSGPGRSG